MKTIRYLLTAVMLVSAFAVTAQAKDAGFALLPALRYESVETTQSTTNKTTSMTIDLALGYKMSNGLLLGASYIMTNGTQDAAGVSTTTANTAYGPTVGYMHDGGFLVKGTYLFSVTQKQTVAGSEETY
ncbi:MAG TPA: hypothetical protein VFV50_05995, partial [Bdellovibrionales bacterium]|nr:hypothetical protein [Bdellovibrionales bacterium]